MRSIRLASGNDAVHLKQAARVEHALLEAGSGFRIVAVPVEGEGGSSLLLEALGERIVAGAAEAAVCPAGLLSSGLPPGVEIGAIFRDSSPAYMWVSCGRPGPGALPHGAMVVTWDDVARAQILFRYPNLHVTSARGWTRVFEGLRQGNWGAACLPPEVVEAGSLWGLDSGVIAESEVMPAIGQGAAALLIPSGTADPHLALLDDPDSRRSLRLESTFWWNAMDLPGSIVTARAVFEGERVRLEGLIAEAEGAWLITDSGEAPVAWGESMVRDLADSCRELAWRFKGMSGVPIRGRVAS